MPKFNISVAVAVQVASFKIQWGDQVCRMAIFNITSTSPLSMALLPPSSTYVCLFSPSTNVLFIFLKAKNKEKHTILALFWKADIRLWICIFHFILFESNRWLAVWIHLTVWIRVDVLRMPRPTHVIVYVIHVAMETFVKTIFGHRRNSIHILFIWSYLSLD